MPREPSNIQTLSLGPTRQCETSYILKFNSCPFSRDYHAKRNLDMDRIAPPLLFVTSPEFLFPSSFPIAVAFPKFSHTREVQSLHIPLKTAVITRLTVDEKHATISFQLMYVLSSSVCHVS
jgi:hypothetical protein